MSSAVVRTITVVIPDWPAVALQHSNDDPLVVLERGRVIAASAVAFQQGVRHGDRRRAAR
jgi:protein ImuB